MLMSVAIANVVISILGFYGAWRVCRFRGSLVRATVALDRAERLTHEILCDAPTAIASKQVRIAQLRYLIRQIDPALTLGKQLLMVVGLLQGGIGLRKPHHPAKHGHLLRRVLPKFR